MKKFTQCLLGSVVGFGFLLAGTFATGQTFGQRCLEHGHAPESPAWARCVKDLAGK